ncbi:MAG: hypothetical protein FJ303_12440 [Planctomycetes bacterium]|nr:hypothetical protein [Planctomycetota bacterium]
MSKRLKQFAEMIDALPSPVDTVRNTSVTILKASAKLIALTDWTDRSGEPGQLAKMHATSTDTANSLGNILGEDHEGVILIRKMLAIAKAQLEGRPEPTDAELDGGGCASMILVAIVIAGGGAWLATY